MMLFRLLTILLFVASWTIMGVAHGVMPTASEIVRVSRAHQMAPRDVDITYVEKKADAPSRRALRIRSRVSGHLRVDEQDLTTGETRTRLWSSAVSGPDVTPPAPWISWILGRDIDGILTAMKVNRERVSLAHDGPVILWVLGATAQESGSPQVHVERESGALRRIVEQVGAGDELRVRAYAIDPPARIPEGEEGPADPWPSGVTVQEGEGQTRYEVLRRVDSPVFTEETFRRPEATVPSQEDLR